MDLSGLRETLGESKKKVKKKWETSQPVSV